MIDRMRYFKCRDKRFDEFLDTVDWNNEKWIERYNSSEDAVRDLLDLWYEVE